MSKTTEYGVRPLDEHGDAIDVSFRPRKEAAIRDAQDMMERRTHGCVAVVVEREVSTWAANDPGELMVREFETVATFGDESALRAGGWEPMAESVK